MIIFASRHIALLILSALLFACVGCASATHTPPLPDPKDPFHFELGTLGLRATDTRPLIHRDTPPLGFLAGTWRGTQQGAIVGVEVGRIVSGLFLQAAANNVQHCHQKGCGQLSVMMGAMSLVVLVATPPTISILGGLTAGISADSSTSVKAGQEALDRAHDILRIQKSMRDQLHLFIQRKLVHPISVVLLPTPEDAEQKDSLGEVDSVLETNVLELGLVEHDPMTSTEKISAVIRPSYHLFVLVQTKLSKPSERRILDEGRFGCLSEPWLFREWAENNASLFQRQLNQCYEKLARQITTTLIDSYVQADE